MNEPGKTSYDLIPYPSHPHPNTHPDRLCAVGRLFGLRAADPRRARVLELGCGSGGNLIPMAYRSPDATFLGVDVSAAPVEEALTRKAELGLSNVEVRRASIAELGDGMGTFDYVICHGVYSWVDDAVRDAVLATCAAALAPQGIAHVSYNTLPGWNAVRTVRDLMLFHVEGLEDPHHRAEQALAVLRFAREAAESQAAGHAGVLAAEEELLADVDDLYVLHDHLGADNRPSYLHEFVASARRHGLDYLGDSEVHTMFAGNLPPAVAEVLSAVEDIVRAEQYMDFVSDRRFRNTLLCRGEVELVRRLEPRVLHDLHLRALVQPEERVTEQVLADGVPLRFSGDGVALTLRSRDQKVALAALARAVAPLSHAALVDRVAGELGVRGEEAGELVDDRLGLLRLVLARSVEVSVCPPAYVGQVAARPVGSALARHDAARGLDVVSERHERVHLGPPEAALLVRLDGTRDTDALAESLADDVRHQRFDLLVDGESVTEPEALASAARTACKDMLASFAANALLVAPPS